MGNSYPRAVGRAHNIYEVAAPARGLQLLQGRVQVDVAHQLKKVQMYLAEDGLVSILEEVA